MSSIVSGEPVNSNQKLRALTSAAVVSVLFALALPNALPFMRVAENWLYDYRIINKTPALGLHPDIVLVSVTEDTLAGFPFRSPLNRRFVGDIIQHLVSSGVRAIGIDSVFDQSTIPEDDLYLHQTIRHSKVPIVVGEAAPQTGLTDNQRAFQKAFLEVLNAAYVNILTDSDGSARQAYRGQQGSKGWVPGLADAVATAVGITREPGVRPIAYYPALEGEPIYKAFRSFPAHTVKLLPPAWFKDKIVLIGAELTLDDRVRTPFSGTVGEIPGVYVHAFALAQILDGRSVTVPSFVMNAGLVAVLVIVGIMLILAPWPLFFRWAAVLIVLVAGWGAAIGFYGSSELMVPLLPPTLALLLSSSLATIYLVYQERQQQRFLHNAFSRYVSPNLVDDIVSNPDKLELEGERRYLTFIFTDLAGFTSLAEQLDPGDIVGLLNGYIDGMCAIVFRHGGTVDKIVGDAVAAYWGAPIGQEDQRARAVSCALEMDEFAEDYRQRNVTVAGMLGLTRIGINSGTAIIGNFGGVNFFDYTAHGDMVNTAARLEGANKYLGTRICVGEETKTGCPQLLFRSVADLILKGKTEPIRVYEPVPDMTTEQVAEFERVFESMVADSGEAQEAYKKLLDRFPNDPVCKLHYDRLGAGEHGSIMTLAGK